MELWAHQKDGVDATWQAIREGVRRVLVTSPTGGGKSAMMAELARLYLADGKPVLLYANRKLLIEQLSRVLSEAGFAHGVRAAGHTGDAGELFQVASIQTEHSRVTRRMQREHHPAKLVLVDEAHCQTGEMFRALMDRHMDVDGAAIVGFTATPIELGDYYDRLIIAGVTSKLRECGALVQAVHYGCDEPDMKKIKVPLGQDLSESQQVAAIMRPGIFGRVWEHFQRLNPERRPTILFAPGVRESLWFAEQFLAKGVTAAHIDGEEVWINGERKPTSPEARKQVLEDSRDGRVCVLCNRFVLREGIDAPWLCHGIFATVYGSLQSYLQSGGRLLRAHPGIDSVTIQDHGGNWWRHGSLNADREWEMDWTAAAYSGIRAERLRGKRCKKCRERLTGPMCWNCNTVNEWEARCCPKCSRVIIGRHCSCGWSCKGEKRSRAVVSVDGKLELHEGDIFVPRRISKHGNGKKIWERMYWRARSEKWNASFAQAMAFFAQENNWGWPDPEWPLMPLDETDIFRKVKDVPMQRLVQKEEANAISK